MSALLSTGTWRKPQHRFTKNLEELGEMGYLHTVLYTFPRVTNQSFDFYYQNGLTARIIKVLAVT